jgi:starvation-inducible DNA-binding protein
MLRHTSISINGENRIALTNLLNQQLILMTDLYLQTKLSHWNVTGPHFIAYHELFDDIASHVLDSIDVIAERATTLGASVNNSAQKIVEDTTLRDWSTEERHDRAMLNRLAGLVGQVANSMRAAIDQASQLGDADTADLFTEVSRQLDKDLWFLEAHMD